MSNWLSYYRTNKDIVWIKGVLTNDEEIFLDSFKSWTALANRLENECLFFKKLSLQFRSHEVQMDITDCDGVYLVRSIIGRFDGNVKETITFGKVKGNSIQKTVYVSPELIVEETYKDTLANSFEEAIIYDKTPKNRQK
jgi:hypothetical protein